MSSIWRRKKIACLPFEEKIGHLPYCHSLTQPQLNLNSSWSDYIMAWTTPRNSVLLLCSWSSNNWRQYQPAHNMYVWLLQVDMWVLIRCADAIIFSHPSPPEQISVIIKLCIIGDHSLSTNTAPRFFYFSLDLKNYFT